MNSITLSFGKDKTFIIKGIAIVFMIMLHCGVADVLKLCVGIYEPLIRISDSLWVVTPWTILLTFVCSWGISKIVEFTQTKIEKI